MLSLNISERHTRFTIILFLLHSCPILQPRDTSPSGKLDFAKFFSKSLSLHSTMFAGPSSSFWTCVSLALLGPYSHCWPLLWCPCHVSCRSHAGWLLSLDPRSGLV